MATLRSCSSCEGFIPEHATACPNCDVAAPRRSRAMLRLAAGVLGGGAFAMTLMACYGRAYSERDAPRPDSKRTTDMPTGSVAAPDATGSATGTTTSSATTGQ